MSTPDVLIPAEAEASRIRSRLERLPIHRDDQAEANAWGVTLTLVARHRLTLYDAPCCELAVLPDLSLAGLDRRLTEAATQAGATAAIHP